MPVNVATQPTSQCSPDSQPETADETSLPRSDGSGADGCYGKARAADDTPPDPPVNAASGNVPADDCPGSDPEDSNTDHGEQGLTKEAFRLLVKRVNCGDEQALGELRHVLDTCPQIWQKIGDIGGHAELSMIRLVAGDDRLLLESLQRKVVALKAELSSPAASMLEQLAVQRVVATWLQVQHADSVCTSTEHSLPQQKYWSQRQDQAHRRHLAGVKQLATLRQLLPVSAEGECQSSSVAGGETSTGKPEKSRVTSRHSGDQHGPEPDEGRCEPYSRAIVPFAKAAGDGRETASG